MDRFIEEVLFYWMTPFTVLSNEYYLLVESSKLTNSLIVALSYGLIVVALFISLSVGLFSYFIE